MKEVGMFCMKAGCGVLASHKSPDGPWLWCYDHKGRDDKPLVAITIPPSRSEPVDPLDPARERFERRLEALRQRLDERMPHMPLVPPLLEIVAERRRRMAETQR